MEEGSPSPSPPTESVSAHDNVAGSTNNRDHNFPEVPSVGCSPDAMPMVSISDGMNVSSRRVGDELEQQNMKSNNVKEGLAGGPLRSSRIEPRRSTVLEDVKNKNMSSNRSKVHPESQHSTSGGGSSLFSFSYKFKKRSTKGSIGGRKLTEKGHSQGEASSVYLVANQVGTSFVHLVQKQSHQNAWGMVLIFIGSPFVLMWFGMKSVLERAILGGSMLEALWDGDRDLNMTSLETRSCVNLVGQFDLTRPDYCCSHGNWETNFKGIDFFFAQVGNWLFFEIVSAMCGAIFVARRGALIALGTHLFFGGIIWTLLWAIQPDNGFGSNPVWYIHVAFWVPAFLRLMSKKRHRTKLKRVIKSLFFTFLYASVIFSLGFSIVLYAFIVGVIDDTIAEVCIVGVMFPCLQVILRELVLKTSKSILMRGKCDEYEGLAGIVSLVVEITYATPGFIVLFSIANDKAFYISLVLSLFLEVVGTYLTLRVQSFAWVQIVQKLALNRDRDGNLDYSFRERFLNILAVKITHEELGEKVALIIGATFCLFFSENSESRVVNTWSYRLVTAVLLEAIVDIAKDKVCLILDIHTIKVKFKLANVFDFTLVSAAICLALSFVATAFSFRCYFY